MASRKYYSEEAKQRAQAERTFLALLFTGLGLSIGAALALLFAPMDGDKLRDELKDHASDARHKFDDYGEQAKKALSN